MYWTCSMHRSNNKYAQILVGNIKEHDTWKSLALISDTIKMDLLKNRICGCARDSSGSG
jgi:hypothetical protein